MQDWNILVVEDDPDGQELVERMLRHSHINVDVVGTAEEALWSFANGKHYTAAILDLALPGMDGWTLLGEIMSNPATANVPCFAMTAYHSPEVAVKALEAGFVAYFPKPLETRIFVSEIQKILG